jgi:membrane protein YdbS with pleckstrin-like domain
MTLLTNRKRQQAGWGIFELLCFIAAFALMAPIASRVSSHFGTVVGNIFFFVASAIVGVILCIIQFYIFRFIWRYKHRARNLEGDKK